MDGSSRTRAASIAAHLAAACVIGLLLWLAFGRTAFVNYDSEWSLNWMRELVAGGTRPDLGRLFSPTPHPLSDLFSGILVPLSDAGGPAVGRGAEDVLVVSALFWLGALAVVTFRLGARWFGPAAGVVAAVLVLTREPVLSYGLRTYLDLPYAVFLLLALLAETRRPRNGARTVAWITLAGLLRPEAWLIAAVYVGYLAVAQARGAATSEDLPARAETAPNGAGAPHQTAAPVDGHAPNERAAEPPPADHPRPRRSLRAWLALVEVRPLLPLVLLALVAPLGWIVEGLVLAGDPLQALTGTQQNAADLDRVTGVGSAVTVMPRRLGEIVREPVLFAAFGGGLLSLAFLRRRAVLGVAAGVTAGVAFFVLAAAGLPLLTRYLVFPATLLIVFAAAGLLGWRHLAPGHPWRRRWQGFAALALLVFVVFAPGQGHRLDKLQSALALQQGVIGDLRTVTGQVVRPTLEGACGIAGRTTPSGPLTALRGDDGGDTAADQRYPDVALPNHRAVPQLLLWLGDGLDGAGGHHAVSVQALGPGVQPSVTLLPSSVRVAKGFILDAADGSTLPKPPAGSVLAGTLGAWTVYGHDEQCASALRTRLTAAR